MPDAFVSMQSRMSWRARSSWMPGMDGAFAQANLEISILSEGADCIGESHQSRLYAAHEACIISKCGAKASHLERVALKTAP